MSNPTYSDRSLLGVCPHTRDKLIFRSKKKAKKVAGLKSKQYHRKFRPYHCPYCGYFHLTEDKIPNVQIPKKVTIDCDDLDPDMVTAIVKELFHAMRLECARVEVKSGETNLITFHGIEQRMVKV